MIIGNESINSGDIYETDKNLALDFNQFNHFVAIHNYLQEHENLLILLGKGVHKIKKKAEQIDCENVISKLNNN